MDDISQCIDDIHFDIKQLRFHVMDDLNLDNYLDECPLFYDYMEAFDGKWSVEDFGGFKFFHDLGENKSHYYEEGYDNPINIMKGNRYTYIQNDEKNWLVCLNENEVKKS
jgi:hypothetical protein